jgi:hypothetical protein
MIISILLALTIIVPTCDDITVTNDTDTPVTYTVQIGEGQTDFTLDAGLSKTWWGDMPHWAVWNNDGGLLAYGTFCDGPEPTPVEQLTFSPLSPTRTVTDTVSVWRGEYKVE